MDPNPWAVRHARYELDVVEGTLHDAQLGDGYDALTMMDVIEHSDPDALVSRAMGRRWPEARRAPEHLVLFSAGGLEQLLRRHGWAPADRHSIGKESSLATLAADVVPLAPVPGRALQRAVARLPLAQRSVDFDPRTKLVLYAVLEP